MANTLRIKRRLAGGASGAPTPLEAGELAVNFTDNKLYIGDGTTAVAIAGKGEFVDLGSEQSVTGKKNFTAATVSTAPVDANDVVRKTDLDDVADSVAALGSAFNYVGVLSGGADAANATDLSALTEKDSGDYYKVTTAGYFILAPDAAFFANVGDGLVFNSVGAIDKIDNTNSEVRGTSNFVSVTGSTDTGFDVDLDSVFKGRVSDLESKTQNIDLTVTGAGTTAIAGEVVVSGKIATTDNAVGVQTAVISPVPGTGNVLFVGGVQLMGPLDMMNNQVINAVLDGGEY